jgi:hypothetical protein
MANQQRATSKGKTAGAAPARRRPGAGSAARPSGATIERDDTYDLISVIYHALQGADTVSQYLEDARRTGSHELVAFFEECRTEHNRRALRGRRLLAARLEGLDDEDDDDVGDGDGGGPPSSDIDDE